MMQVHSDKPGYAFGDRPPKEVTDFLKLKENRPSWNFREVEPEEHAVAFTVAKSAGFDILDDVRDALQRALEKGETFETFRKGLTPTLQAKGWWGEREEANPATGERRIVQLGSPRRLRTIYRANMRSARAAGQWQRIERTKAALPYLLYLLGPSERHRPSHLSKAGLVLPVDDPFWREWMPPNGWGCKCHVRQITAREAESRGVSNSPDIPREERVNPETGERRSLPRGLDPAWAGNPGLTRLENVGRLLGDKLAGAPPAVARVAARDLATSWRAMRIHLGEAPGEVPIAVLPPRAVEALGARQAVVMYSDATAAHVVERRARLPVDALAALHPGLEGEDVFADAKGLVVFGAGLDGLLYRFMLKRTRAGEVYLSTFHRSTAEQARSWRRKADDPKSGVSLMSRGP